MVSDHQRQMLVENAAFLIGKHGPPHINYAEIRPMPYVRYHTMAEVVHALDGDGTIDTDCSGAVTSLFKWSGLRDPNGLGYNGQGYTGTLYDHLPHYYNVEDAHPGALLIFGKDPTVHVCMVMQRNGDNPYLFSHGQEGGPFHISLADERQAHEGQVETWLNIGNL